jgi:hypothetical protein
MSNTKLSQYKPTAPLKPSVDQDTLTVLTFVEQLARAGFWGNITLKLQAGSVVHLVREESLKPEQLIPEQRNNDEHFNS